jgi:hypothetical protein
MAGNVEAQIKPDGLSQRSLVDILYMIVYSIQGICQKLDDDDTTDDTYEAKVYTAIFNGSIEDGRGNSIQNRANDGAGTYVPDDRFFIIKPNGIGNKELLECLYQIFDMLETLTEQLDADDATDATHEALCYTAILVWIIENCKGDQIGNGTAYYLRSASVDQKELVDIICNILDSLETLTEQLDTEAAPAGTDYEELWFTDTILLRVGDSQGLYSGNDITVTP